MVPRQVDRITTAVNASTTVFTPQTCPWFCSIPTFHPPFLLACTHTPSPPPSLFGIPFDPIHHPWHNKVTNDAHTITNTISRSLLTTSISSSSQDPQQANTALSPSACFLPQANFQPLGSFANCAMFCWLTPYPPHPSQPLPGPTKALVRFAPAHLCPGFSHFPTSCISTYWSLPAWPYCLHPAPS